MGIVGIGIGHPDALDLIRAGVVAANIALQIARIPNDAVIADDDVVGPGALIDIAAGEFTGFDVELGQVAAALADKPDGVGGLGVRITGAAAIGHLPFLDLDWVLGVGGGGRVNRDQSQRQERESGYG